MMKKINYLKSLFLLAILCLSTTKMVASNDFYYDKLELELEFNRVNESTVTDHEVSVLSGSQKDTSSFTIYDIELEAFCIGFCCWPLGSIKYTDKKTSAYKRKSFWTGCASSSGTFILVLILLGSTQSFLIVE